MRANEYVEQLKALHDERGVPFRPNQAATSDQLSAAERAIGFAIEGGLRDLWQICNGMERYTTFFGVMSDEPTPCRLLTIEKAVREFGDRQLFPSDFEQDSPRDPRISGGWSNRRWLPFAEFNGFSTCVMYDRAPAGDGIDGQIIVYQHDPDAIYWVAENFAAFLDASMEILRRERFVE